MVDLPPWNHEIVALIEMEEVSVVALSCFSFGRLKTGSKNAFSASLVPSTKALGQMQLIQDAMMHPEKYDYKPKNFLYAAYLRSICSASSLCAFFWHWYEWYKFHVEIVDPKAYSNQIQSWSPFPHPLGIVACMLL